MERPSLKPRSYVGLSFLTPLSDTPTPGGHPAVVPEHLQNHGLCGLFQMSPVGKAAGQPLALLSYPHEVTLMLMLMLIMLRIKPQCLTMRNTHLKWNWMLMKSMKVYCIYIYMYIYIYILTIIRQRWKVFISVTRRPSVWNLNHRILPNIPR